MRYVTLSESIVLLYLVIFIREVENLEDAFKFLDQGIEIDIELNRIDKSDIEAVRIYKAQGMKPIEISGVMNIHYQTVYKILRILNKNSIEK